jgi:hypothetical protein
MNIYKSMYYKLFNAATDALDALNRGDVTAAKELLIRAQQEVEGLYLDADEAVE